MIGTRAERAARSAVLVFGLSLAGATLVAVSLLAAKPAHAVSTFTVNRTADLADSDLTDNTCDTLGLLGSQCTLRAAIQQANATANSGGPDVINFAIPGNGPHTIAPTSQLPTITQPVTINGYSEALGESTPANPNTATDGTTNAVLRIVLNGASAPPTTDTQGVSGLLISGGGTTIRGLVINGFRAANKGTEGEGIFLLNLAGNTNNVIAGNFIGTNAAGDTSVSNEGPGILVFGPNSAANTIGGTAPADHNLISGNLDDGVALLSTNNLVQNNLIGTNKSGTNTPNNLGNGDRGVAIFSPGSNNAIGSVASAPNIIAFNGQEGVEVGAGSGTSNSIRDNSIFENVGIGIDLNSDGPTANDPKDPDTGPNNLQNKPVLTSATTTGGTTTINGKLNSTPNTFFTVQFFASPAADPSGFGEGQTFLGQTPLKTNKKGKKGFTFTTNQDLSGQIITATATNVSIGGGTSEFSSVVIAS